jgi:hypothetical protein
MTNLPAWANGLSDEEQEALLDVAPRFQRTFRTVVDPFVPTFLINTDDHEAALRVYYYIRRKTELLRGTRGEAVRHLLITTSNIGGVRYTKPRLGSILRANLLARRELERL